MAEDYICFTKCFRALQCFQKVNLSRLRRTVAVVLNFSINSRQLSLSEICASLSLFQFYVRVVRSVFLTEAFRFITDLHYFCQADVWNPVRWLKSTGIHEKEPLSAYLSPSSNIAPIHLTLGTIITARDTQWGSDSEWCAWWGPQSCWNLL